MKHLRKAGAVLLLATLLLVSTLLFSSCANADGSCKHIFADADCMTPKICILCGVTEGEPAGHTGGKATCSSLAVCKKCGESYGEFTAHAPAEDDGDCTTAIYCTVCNAVTTEAKAAHTPDEDDGNCLTAVYCTDCDCVAIAAKSAHTPDEDDGDCTTAVYCTDCDYVAIAAEEAHTPDEDDGDCTTAIYCTECDQIVIAAKAGHTPLADDGDCTTAIHCTVCGTVTTAAKSAHTPDEDDGNCLTAVDCTECDCIAIAAKAQHTPEADDGDCTTAVKCTECEKILTEAIAAHTGGTATCEKRAECSVCGKEYGELTAHEGELVWIKHLDLHYRVYSCCYSPTSEPEEHTVVGGACTVCGFNPAVTVPSLEVLPGDTQISVVISIKDNPGIAGLMLTVQYDEDVLHLTGTEGGDALEALTFTAPETLRSGCSFLWDSVEIADKDIKDGELLRLTFDVSSEAPEGTYSLLLKIRAYDNELRPFTLLIESGTIVIKTN